jgi:hypothetical protein
MQETIVMHTAETLKKDIKHRHGKHRQEYKNMTPIKRIRHSVSNRKNLSQRYVRLKSRHNNSMHNLVLTFLKGA